MKALALTLLVLFGCNDPLSETCARPNDGSAPCACTNGTVGMTWCADAAVHICLCVDRGDQ